MNKKWYLYILWKNGYEIEITTENYSQAFIKMSSYQNDERIMQISIATFSMYS